MRKGTITVALTAALAALQAVTSYIANSPGMGPVIGGNGGDSDYGIGKRVGRALGKGTIGIAQEANTVQISRIGATTNGRGQVIVEDMVLELTAGDERAVAGLPENTVTTTNGINSDSLLSGMVPGTDLDRYNVLISTHAVVAKDVVTDIEKAGMVEVPLYVPNLVNGLGEIQVLFYNNLTDIWTVIQPSRVDAVPKIARFDIPDSGTFSVIYKRQSPEL